MLFRNRTRLERVDARIDNLREDLKMYREKVYELEARIDRILEYLKVSEVTINKTVLRSKDEPEEG